MSDLSHNVASRSDKGTVDLTFTWRKSAMVNK